MASSRPPLLCSLPGVEAATTLIPPEGGFVLRSAVPAAICFNNPADPPEFEEGLWATIEVMGGGGGGGGPEELTSVLGGGGGGAGGGEGAEDLWPGAEWLENSMGGFLKGVYEINTATKLG